MDWFTDFFSGIGDAIGSSVSDMMGNVTGSIWSAFFNWIYSLCYQAASDFFELMGEMGAALFDLNWVSACLTFFQYFGWAMFIVGLAIAIFDTAIEYQSSHAINIKMQIMPMIYGLLAVNLFAEVPVRLYTFCINTQKVFMTDLGEYVAGGGGKDVREAALEALGKTAGSESLLFLIFIIALAYCVVKVFLSNIKRGGILLTQIAVGSLYMATLPKGNTEGFVSWMKQVIALCVTSFMQMTLLYLGLLTWHTNILLGLGVMLAANEVPRVAQRFGMDTGFSGAINNVVSNTSTAVNFTRQFSSR